MGVHAWWDVAICSRPSLPTILVVRSHTLARHILQLFLCWPHMYATCTLHGVVCCTCTYGMTVHSVLEWLGPAVVICLLKNKNVFAWCLFSPPSPFSALQSNSPPPVFWYVQLIVLFLKSPHNSIGYIHHVIHRAYMVS